MTTATLCSALVGRREAAQLLGVAPATLANWSTTRRYGLPVVKIGRLAKYRLRDIEAFIEQRTIGADAPV